MIRPLAPEVCSRLRSGIATPTVAQCVEELVLNSIDAGATCLAIRVDIANYKIQVIDNGCGLDKNGMDIVGERYATSKCHDMKDLDNLSFFGYRGEALASISHISGVLEIVSRRRGSEVTYSKLFRNGKPSAAFESSKLRPSPGTTITVHSIFQNLPVRRKMLSPSLDYERIRKRIQGLAIIQPEVSITLRDDSTGTVSIQTPCTSSIATTFGCLFGQDYSKALKEVRHCSSAFVIHGFIGTEGHFNKKLQFVYVNKRFVMKTKLHKLTNLLLGRSLIAKRKVKGESKDTQQSKDVAYSDLSSPATSQDWYGMYVLNIDCPLSEYDITLDPGKTLVEFKNWTGILQCLEELIVNFLRKENLTMKLDNPSPDCPVEEVELTQIGNDDSQEDNVEGMSLSEEATERIADLTEKYGRGIHTSNCSNTLQSLTVRRGVVQSSSRGQDKMPDESEDPDADDIPSQSRATDVDEPVNTIPENVYVASPDIMQQGSIASNNSLSSTKCGGNFNEKNEQLASRNVSRTAKLMAAKTPTITEILVISDSDESVSRESANTATPSVESTYEGQVDKIPDSLSSCSGENSSSMPPDTSIIKDTTQEIEVQPWPVRQPDSIETPRSNQTSDADVIETSSYPESVHSSSPLSSSHNETENEEPDSRTLQKTKPHELITTAKDDLQLGTKVNGKEHKNEGTFCTPNLELITTAYDKKSKRTGSEDISDARVEESSKTKFKEQHHEVETKATCTKLLETYENFNVSSEARIEKISQAKPIANAVSDCQTSEEKQSRQVAECLKANTGPSENVFLKRPLLHSVRGVTTQEPKCVNDLGDENFRTPVGRHPPVTIPKINLQHTLSTLRSFRYQKARENHFKTPNRGTNTDSDCTQQSSSIGKLSCQYQSSLHVFKQLVKPRSAVKEQNLKTVVNSPECSSTLLLSKEQSVPQLGNAVLMKHASSAATSVIMPGQKTQIMRQEECEQINDGSTISSEHVVKNIGNKTDSCSDLQTTFIQAENKNIKAKDNSAAFKTADHFDQDDDSKEMDTDSSWNGKCTNQSDSIVNPACKPKPVQKKPNLKRLRSQCISESVKISRMYPEKNRDNPPPGKIFLTSESFLVSAQDLLHRPTVASGTNLECSLLSAEDVESKVEASGRKDVWSGIEEDCRKANKTSATETCAIVETSGLDGRKAKCDTTQELARDCALNLSRQSGLAEPDNHLTINQTHNLQRHSENIELPQTSTKGSRDKSTLIAGVTTDAPSEILVTNVSICNQVNPTENSATGIDKYDKEKQYSNEGESVDRGLRKDIPDSEKVNTGTSSLCQTLDPVDHIEDENSVSNLVHTPTDAKEISETKCCAGATPLQSTQSFSPSSTDILVEAMASDQEFSNSDQDKPNSDEGGAVETSNTAGLKAGCSGGRTECMSDKLIKPVDSEKTTDVKKQESGSDATGTETQSESDKIRSTVDHKWVSHYDPKKGQIVYVNIQTGNCSLQKPNQEGNLEGGEGRKDFKDGAGASSSVNAFMTNTGQVHPHLSHNATPFLPRSKKQRLGVCNDIADKSGAGEMSAVTSKAVDKLVESHLEKEDQEIASKWRDGTKESNFQGDDVDGDSFQQLLSEWSNPTYASMETSIFDIRSNQTPANAVKIHGTLHPYKFTKAMFQNMKVIGQVDNKFISCMVNTDDKVPLAEPNLLILIDQHAAHERVRLEQLIADAYKEPLTDDSAGEDSEDSLPVIKTSSVLPPVQVTLSAENVRLIKAFKPKLRRLGVGIRLHNDDPRGESGDVEITHLPACMVEREAHELRRGRQPVALTMVESLIKEQLDLLQDTSGACAVLPKTITKLLNSQACHGAIKFGDTLAGHECRTLIGQLSQCDLPFQCAHGRPSLIPVLDVKLLASKLQTNETDLGKPQLWKLKKGLHSEEGQ